MLRKNPKAKIEAAGGRFAIVASKYNDLYVDAMLETAKGELTRAGVADIHVVRVPGAFEVPVVAAKLASAGNLSAIICLGVIFQGETSHAQHVGWGVTHALAQVQINHHIPIIHGVFIFEKEKHARVRCLGKKHNRGTETALTALEMAQVMKTL